MVGGESLHEKVRVVIARLDADLAGMAAFGHGARGPKTPEALGWKLKMPAAKEMVRKTYLLVQCHLQAFL
ncbi:hypothetical protein [Prochlorococcus sp. P1344]|uniref:hypothetical protein n=1 Tax=Prochlorococcus sp. P1344 TaxID=2729591 RepID=UPI0019821F91|nr:hypothetical protein [Prochlorococcus sp. P1344]